MAELSGAAEKATEAAKVGAEAVEEVVGVARNHVAWWWGGWISGVVTGLAGGFWGARRYLEPKYEKIAEDEIDMMRDHFHKRMVVRETKPDLTDLSKKVQDLGYRGEPNATVLPADPPAPGEPNVQVGASVSAEDLRNVFGSVKDASDGWDFEAEKALRTEGGTYVIHKEEYGESDYNETTLSYYAGDDILCDEHDRIIENPEKIVGDCLDKFGHGSNDHNVVYVRNEVLAVDLEVVKSDKTYAEEVHGFKHEDPPRRRAPKYRE